MRFNVVSTSLYSLVPNDCAMGCLSGSQGMKLMKLDNWCLYHYDSLSLRQELLYKACTSLVRLQASKTNYNGKGFNPLWLQIKLDYVETQRDVGWPISTIEMAH